MPLRRQLYWFAILTCLYVALANPDLSAWWGGIVVPANPLPPIPLGLRVLILEESSERGKLPIPQLSAMTSEAVRTYLDAKAAKNWRLLDDDFESASLTNESQSWRDWYAKAKTDGKDKLPWLLVGNGKSGESRAFPANEAEMLALLQKYGGS